MTEKPNIARSFEWTREASSAWWDAAGHLPGYQERYFSQLYGPSIFGGLRSARVGLRERRVLDFGCGTGYLLDHLLAHGLSCRGCDFSPEAVTTVQDRLGSNPLFEGADLVDSYPTQYKDGSFDLLFFIETIEHLLDDSLSATMHELSRLIAAGGSIVVTTPNAEDLGRAEVLCPSCFTSFHPVQHVRSWTATSLARFMAEHDFQRVACRPLYFRSSWARSRVATLAAKALRKKLPHLMYVGRKTG